MHAYAPLANPYIFQLASHAFIFHPRSVFYNMSTFELKVTESYPSKKPSHVDDPHLWKTTSRPRSLIIQPPHPPPNLPHHPLLRLLPSLTLRVSYSSDSKIQPPAQLYRRNRSTVHVLRWISRRHQAASFLQQADASRDVPFPAALRD